MATQMIDIGLGPGSGGEDLAISNNGDFVASESTAWHQQELILNNKGEFKQHPTICVGVFDYFNDENPQDIVRAIAVEFTRDGMDVVGINLTNAGVISSDAFYP